MGERVIFLDIDGVLNDDTTTEVIAGFLFVDEDKVERLSRIVKATGAKIVLSSTWRLDWGGPDKPELGTSLYALRTVFRKYGMEIVDKTPLIVNEDPWKDVLRGSREKEVFNWLSKHPEVEKFIIIDDMEYLFSSKEALEHLVLTDEYDGGLTEELAQQAITMLM